METPSVHNVVIDKNAQIKYDVMAYRKLSLEEILLGIRVYHSNRRRKPKKGTVVQIISTIGLRD